MKTTTIQYIHDTLKEKCDKLESEFNDLCNQQRALAEVSQKGLTSMDVLTHDQLYEKCRILQNHFFAKKQELECAQDAYCDFCEHQW